MMRAGSLLAVLALAACDLPPPDPFEVADKCEEQGWAAQAPETSVTLGVNSETGGFAGGSFSVSSDFLRGLDPQQVYERCVFQRTGEIPVRPFRPRIL